MTIDTQKWISLTELSKILGMNKEYVRSLIKRNKLVIPHFRFGKRGDYRFNLADVERFIEDPYQFED